MRHYGLSWIRKISLSMFLFIGFFGWSHLLPTLFTTKGKGEIWMVIVPMILVLTVAVFDCIVLEKRLGFKTLLGIGFIGAGYCGGLDLIQSQHSTSLSIAFHIFTYTPITLGFLYLILINKEKRSN